MTDAGIHALNLDIPAEMSEDEFAEMIVEASKLTEAEAREEYLESCRFGDIDVVRILLRRFPSLVECSNEVTGNTGMHMAAANGHIHVARLLLQCNHGLSKNASGNSPLHFAAINSQEQMVQFLTQQTYQDIDVLEKNMFGRSALTEGFSSQDTGVVKALLEHDSANEERLLETNTNAELQHVHNFCFGPSALRVRELAIIDADNPFADTDRPDQDTTGLSIWSAALILARWMHGLTWDGASVLELGAGCGVPGLTIGSARPGPSKVFVTDLNPDTVENLKYNITLNDLTNTQAFRMDWSDRTTWPTEKLDYVVGSDLIYQKSLVPLLVQVVMGLLKPGGTFYYVAPNVGRDGLIEFIDRMKEVCPVWNEQNAPPEFHANPLANNDDEECFMHFLELSTLTYCLYEFTMPNS